MGLTRVELENFTAFRSLKLDLCPGINVLVGANGTGKTHYADVQIMPMSGLICGSERSSFWKRGRPPATRAF